MAFKTQEVLQVDVSRDQRSGPAPQPHPALRRAGSRAQLLASFDYIFGTFSFSLRHEWESSLVDGSF